MQALAKSLEAGKLIVGAIAVSIDPTGTAAAALGIDTALTFKNWLTGKSDLAKLARDLDKKFQTELKSPRFDKPADARSLLPQMLEAAFPKGADFASAGLDPDEILNAMHSALRAKDSEYRKPEIVTAFDQLLHPLLQSACDDPRLETALRPHLTRKQMADQKEVKNDVKDMKSMMEDFLGGKTIPLEDMKALAARFDEHDISDKASLEHFLKLKADEYRALKSEVDQIDAGLKRLSNLKAAAQDAIARVDLDEVEDLLSRVQEVELDEAAKTAELRATNALLRGKTEQAFALLSAAADSFTAVSKAERITRRLYKYTKIMRDHALRYGGAGFDFALRILGAIEDDIDAGANPNWYADLHIWKGLALQEQGQRTSGAAGADLLAEAVRAYRDALRIYTEADHPVDWAMTQNNLAIALKEQGIRTSGAAGADLLAEAVRAYRDALRITTEADHPVQWAATQNNLAIALQEQGQRTSGAAGADLLAEAVRAYRDALRIRTEADHPVQWATTQNNLAIALKEQGKRTSGAAGADLLAEAVHAYREALRIRTEADHPVDWAATQNNLANALQEQGKRTSGAAGADLLAEAVHAFRDAQRITTEADHPVQWAMTQENMAITELAIAHHEATSDPRLHLSTALTHVDNALTKFDPTHMPYNHNKATHLRKQILDALNSLDTA